MGIAPMGYKNTRDDNNKPIVTPDENAPFIKMAFEEMATGNYTQEEIRKRLKSRGFSCSKNCFNKTIRNPVYAGRIYIPAFKDEGECYIKAHDPIVEDSLFFKVQDINGRKPINTTKTTCREEFPLRGFLQCCKCGKSLTGSSGLSKLKKRYYYYHCTKGRKEIYSAEKVHAAFEKLLATIVAKKEVIELYQHILKAFFGQNNDERLTKIKKIKGEVEKNKDRINTATRMMLDNDIQPSEYKEIKLAYEDINTTLLRERASLEIDKIDYSTKLMEALIFSCT
jgi:site-specific DNA recombinase